MTRGSRSGAGDLVRTLLVAAGVLFGVAALAWGLVGGRFKGYEGGSVDIVIPRGSTPSEVARLLEEAGVIRSPLLFRIGARLTGGSGRLQAGEYRFEGPLSPWQVLDRLLSGKVLLHRLTIPEGLTGQEILLRVADLGLAALPDLKAAFAEPTALGDLDPGATDLEGYLFPDTYHFARPTAASEILGEMVSRFREEAEEDLIPRARALGLTVREMVTLASLIEKETSVPSERTRVSAVFHNRLARGMPLQCDPTVIFALASDGLYRGVLTREDLDYASPYNTYVHAGLPPGPIAAPGRAALEAAVAPADVPDLDFVADGSGGHHFSRSLDEHLRAVERYRRARRRGT